MQLPSQISWHFGFGRNPMIADSVLSALEYDCFREKPRRFGLRFVHADADVAQKLGLLPDIRAQLCPETRALPPCGGQVHDGPDAKAVIPGGRPRCRYDRRPPDREPRLAPLSSKLAIA